MIFFFPFSVCDSLTHSVTKVFQEYNVIKHTSSVGSEVFVVAFKSFLDSDRQVISFFHFVFLACTNFN